ncbi:hypothetical protein SAMN02745174_01535 [Cetobacterium ceti]|uniref:DUF5666 domain-containing protein n=1 Tax=Cetobacterium ceti TaxID=180163 RepID=A0A1T4NFA3_9FUSO|nr:hypothetical protein [Cetobacterium ceti]SJZ77894.1 hypothetical protein SAMN02745174_01535 [Cetobacterium ceti]
MKKIGIGLCLLLAMSTASFAGIIKDHGKKYLTAIKTYDKGDHIRFKGVFPKVSFRVRKKDIIKSMLRIGTTTTIGHIERNGIIQGDRNLIITLKRQNDGLWIKAPKVSMFVTEKELDKVRR